MVVEAIRLLVTLIVTAVGFQVGSSLGEALFESQAGGAITGALLGAGVGYVLGGAVGRAFSHSLDRAPNLVRSATGPELFAGAFGVGVGVIVGAIVGVPAIVFLPPGVGWPLAALTVLVTASVGARLFSARAHDLIAVAGLQQRTPLAKRRLGDDPTRYLIDSSAAIDGRLLYVVRSGVIEGTMWVPTFVVDELQSLADSGDRAIRRRGRRGLDVIQALQAAGAEVEILEETVPEVQDVDAKLTSLAAGSGAVLVTTDSNLAKAAEVRGIRVLNVQALAEDLKPPVSSGDMLTVAIAKSGNEPGQGVGYLDDGTMVVVEDASARVGENLEVEVTGATRTAVGRLVFGRPTG